MNALILPVEIPSQNVTDRQHWRQRHNFGKACALWLMALSLGGIPKATGPRRLVITAYRKRRIADDANLRGGAKALVDAIVRAGLLLDDNDTLARIEYRQKLVSNSTTGKPETHLSFTDVSSTQDII